MKPAISMFLGTLGFLVQLVGAAVWLVAVIINGFGSWLAHTGEQFDE